MPAPAPAAHRGGPVSYRDEDYDTDEPEPDETEES